MSWRLAQSTAGRWATLGLCGGLGLLGGCDGFTHWLTDPEIAPRTGAGKEGSSEGNSPPPGISFRGGKLTAKGEPVSLEGPSVCASFSTFRSAALDTAESGDRAVLEQWRPPEPAGRAQRTAAEKVTRDYVDQCSLSEVVGLATQLIAQPTVGDGSPVSTHAAFVASKALLQKFAKANALGFESTSDDSVWLLTLGHGPRNLLMLTHLDVVSPGPNWGTPPFAARVVDHRRLVGRGAIDNKGPLAAALVVLKTLSSAGLAPAGQVGLAISTTAEVDRSGMEAFLSHGHAARHVLALDSSFPTTTREFGQVGWYLQAAMGKGSGAGKGGKNGPTNLPQLTGVEAGNGLQQVPATAVATFKAATRPQLLDLQTRLKSACERISATYHQPSSVCGLSLSNAPGRSKAASRGPVGSLKLSVRGKMAMAAYPENGLNALVVLSQILHGLKIAPNGSLALLAAVRAGLTDHVAAPFLGLQYEEKRSGALVVEPTGLHISGGQAYLDVSLFRPRGLSAAAVAQRLIAATRALQAHVSPLIRTGSPPSIGNPFESRADAAFVGRLRDLFTSTLARRQLTPLDPDEQLPQQVRYPSLMRSFPQAIGFGPMLPNHPNLAHSVDESIDLSLLGLLASTYFDAMVQLD